MGITLSLVRKHTKAGLRQNFFDATFDSSYVAGGEALTAASLGLRVAQAVEVTPQSGYTFEYDYSNAKLQAWRAGAPGTSTGVAGSVGYVDDNDNAATVGHALYVVRNGGPNVSTLVAESSATGLIIDSDTAATEGVQIYLVIDDPEFLPNFQLGHLEFVSPTNAHGSCTVFNGGPTLLIEDDDDAATNGVEVRAIAASGGLEATIAGSGGTALVPLSDGQYLHIADSTTGSTPAVYFDEDAANTYDRLRAVVVDNANEPYKLAEVSSALDRPGAFSSSRMASLVTVGPGDSVSQGTVGSGGPEFDVIHDAAAAQMVGAAPLFVKAAGAGFNAAVPGGEDVFIPCSNGEVIRVAYAASPTGVQVYWDHDAANSYERMKGVIVDNADEPFSAESTGLAEVAAGADLSGVTTRVYAVGR